MNDGVCAVVRGRHVLLLLLCVLSAVLTRVEGFGIGGISNSKKAVSTSSLPSFLVPLVERVTGVEQRRKAIKSKLLELCRQPSKIDRKDVEDILVELMALSPVTNTATSPLLQKNWLLLYTTEKEINFFVDNNISNEITQLIDFPRLNNLIQFRNGNGSFSVEGTLSVAKNDNTDDGDENTGSAQQKRTNFSFVSATLDLGRWGKFSIPPVGKGWFDTIYLDQDLRVDTNSRNDILICIPK